MKIANYNSNKIKKTFFKSKKYRNPFHINQKNINQKKQNIKGIIIIIITLIVLVFIAWVLLYSSLFKIKKIIIEGNASVDNSKIKEIVYNNTNQSPLIFMPTNNIFFVNVNKLKDELNKNFSFQELELKIKWPNSIIVKCKEKEYVFVWKENDNVYLLDKDGIILKKINIEEIKNYLQLPLISNETLQKIELINFNDNYFNFIATLNNELIKKNEIKVEKYVFDNDKIVLKVLNGPFIYFNITEPIEKQLNKLYIIKKETLKDTFNKKEYIDLRFGDNIYIYP